ncbi:hypothetical protein [Streptomyces fodineus]|uniref:hypothetical protein n=1 Tax=Streptomyces fodineus TaxID=1904616 RepID=UPI00131A829E
MTVRMARAGNPHGTAAMWVLGRLDGLFADADFAGWYPADRPRGLSPAQLALVSVLQYAENLTDRRQTADAVRCRLDVGGPVPTVRTMCGDFEQDWGSG